MTPTTPSAGKPREFWIKIVFNEDPEKLGDRFVYDQICTDNDGTAQRIHVIEHSAYESLQKELSDAGDEIDYLNRCLGTVTLENASLKDRLAIAAEAIETLLEWEKSVPEITATFTICSETLAKLKDAEKMNDSSNLVHSRN